MAIDCFIKFDGVAGESTDKDHKGGLTWCPGIAVHPTLRQRPCEARAQVKV